MLLKKAGTALTAGKSWNGDEQNNDHRLDGQKPVGAVFLCPFGGDSMDLTEIMQEAQQSLGGDYEQLAVSNVQC